MSRPGAVVAAGGGEVEPDRRDEESVEDRAAQGLSILGRLGLAGRTGFYLILTGITARIAALGGQGGHQADAHGALALVSRPLVGKMAIAAVGLGFVLFGAGRLAGAWHDDSVSRLRRLMTAFQGVFYVAIAYVPISFLAGNTQTGSQQQQQRTTADLLALPAGREVVVVLGVVLILVCAQQVHGALRGDFRDGLDLERAPRLVTRFAGSAGTVGITARALVFLPIGFFFIVSAVRYDAKDSYGTDAELLHLSGHPWGVALLGVVTAGLAVFVLYSGIETRYRNVISAR